MKTLRWPRSILSCAWLHSTSSATTRRSPLPLLGARFEYPAPTYQARYEERFACPLEFNATSNAFAFDRQRLDQPLPLADAVTHRAMTERCRKQNTEFTGRQAWLGRVRQLLAAQLPAAPGLE